MAALILVLPGAGVIQATKVAHSTAGTTEPGEFTPRDCPAISGGAMIIARVSEAPSGAPATLHPGLDLWVKQGHQNFVLRIHFGDRGDGLNSCLAFNECKDVQELPGKYRVSPQSLKALLDYLRGRNFAVGRFVSWGVPILPWGARGSNCGDAFLETVYRLGIADEALPDMQQWIHEHDHGRLTFNHEKWSFDRGLRRPDDEFYHASHVHPAQAGARTLAMP